MNKIKKTNKIIGIVLFLIYLLFLAYFMFFSEELGRKAGQNIHSYNFELFKEIKRFYIYRNKLGYSSFFLNIIGNIVAFIPFGFFRPIIGIRKHSLLRTVSQGFAFSSILEFLQILTLVGSFDVDDIFLNTVGCFLGYILFLIFYNKHKNILEI